MRFHPDKNKKITGRAARGSCVSLARNGDTFAVLNSGRDGNHDLLAFFLGSRAAAFRAGFFDNFSLASARGAGRGHGKEARALAYLARALAGGTDFLARTAGSPGTPAGLAGFIFIILDFDFGAENRVFKRNLNVVAQIGALPGAAASSGPGLSAGAGGASTLPALSPPAGRSGADMRSAPRLRARGRRNRSDPAPATASTARTMIRMTYSITLSVFQNCSLAALGGPSGPSPGANPAHTP